jgi:hypothetical protein
MLDIAAQRIVHAHGFAYIVRGRANVLDFPAENQTFDLVFDPVIQLISVGAEELNPVVIGIVRGRDDDPASARKLRVT